MNIGKYKQMYFVCILWRINIVFNQINLFLLYINIESIYEEK